MLVRKFTHYNRRMLLHTFQRPVATVVANRLAETPERIQILAGPRQVGKTTLVDQILNSAGRPVGSRALLAAEASPVAVDAALGWDRPLHISPDWLVAQWTRAEASARAWDESKHPAAKTTPFVLAIDEVQRLPQWSSLVKGLWDRTISLGVRMHVLLLGSSPVLMQKGLTESLLGRFEVLRLGHWSFDEMNTAFGLTIEQYLYFGGFPGSARFIGDETRWRDYVRESLIAPNIERDVFEMFRVDKPALMRELFSLGCAYSGQIMALDKAKGRLGGHTLTLSHQLTLLSHAGLLTGLHKYAGQVVRQRQSPPKFMVHNTALMSAMGSHGFDEARADRSHWGRVVESAVGAHLINTADGDTKLHYWRDGDDEADFVVERRGRLTAIEVKSRPDAVRHRGLNEFQRRHPNAKTLLVGGDELPLGEFLRRPTTEWVR
ncbi:MAG: ATP-binding protein [Rubrivivax sp.]|jgi:predicted AAA+ superfamily ATPase